VTRQNPEEEVELDTADEEDSGLAWGVEVTPSGPGNSVFFSARRVILSGDHVEIQLLNGKYMSYPIDQVRKVLSMRATGTSGYTGDTPLPDEFY
jgi:hypothetical protein